METFQWPRAEIATMAAGQSFLMEARMTGKVESKKLKTGGLAFGGGFVSLFTFALLLFCALLFLGCESQNINGAELERIKGMPAEARKVNLLKLLERKFENPDAHFELGQLYKAEGLWSKAEYHYGIALRFDPAHAQAQAAMVKLFLDSGDATKAKNYADIYMNQVAASALQSLRLAMAFQMQQHDEYALACYRQALNLEPDSARIHKQIAYYYLSKSDKTQAKEYFTRSFQLDPKQPDVALELGLLGVEVRIPRNTEKNNRKLDEVVEQSSKQKTDE